MKIAFLSQEIPGINENGGIGFHFLGLAQQLCAQGHDLTIFFDGLSTFQLGLVKCVGVWSTTSIGKYLEKQTRSHELVRSCAWNLLARKAITATEVLQRFDIIETHEFHAFPMLLSLGKERVVLSLHGGKEQTARLNQEFDGFSQQLMARLEKITVQRSNHRYAVSQLQARTAEQFYQVPVTQVIPNPIDTALFSSVGVSSPRKAPYILFVGRIERRKGIVTLLDVYTRLFKKYGKKLPDLVCIGDDYYHLGEAQNLSFPDHLKKLPDAVSKKIIYIPQVTQSDLVPYYTNAVCCVFPSLEEPFGNVIGEAMSCGAVVVTTKTTGIREWLSDGEDVVLTDPEALALSKTLENCLFEMTDKQRLSMKRKARETVVKHFTSSGVAKKIVTYYSRLLQQK